MMKTVLSCKDGNDSSSAAAPPISRPAPVTQEACQAAGMAFADGKCVVNAQVVEAACTGKGYVFEEGKCKTTLQIISGQAHCEEDGGVWENGGCILKVEVSSEAVACEARGMTFDDSEGKCVEVLEVSDLDDQCTNEGGVLLSVGGVDKCAIRSVDNYNWQQKLNLFQVPTKDSNDGTGIGPLALHTDEKGNVEVFWEKQSRTVLLTAKAGSSGLEFSTGGLGVLFPGVESLSSNIEAIGVFTSTLASEGSVGLRPMFCHGFHAKWLKASAVNTSSDLKGQNGQNLTENFTPFINSSCTGDSRRDIKNKSHFVQAVYKSDKIYAYSWGQKIHIMRKKGGTWSPQTLDFSVNINSEDNPYPYFARIDSIAIAADAYASEYEGMLLVGGLRKASKTSDSLKRTLSAYRLSDLNPAKEVLVVDKTTETPISYTNVFFTSKGAGSIVYGYPYGGKTKLIYKNFEDYTPQRVFAGSSTVEDKLVEKAEGIKFAKRGDKFVIAWEELNDNLKAAVKLGTLTGQQITLSTNVKKRIVGLTVTDLGAYALYLETPKSGSNKEITLHLAKNTSGTWEKVKEIFKNTTSSFDNSEFAITSDPSGQMLIVWIDRSPNQGNNYVFHYATYKEESNILSATIEKISLYNHKKPAADIVLESTGKSAFVAAWSHELRSKFPVHALQSGASKFSVFNRGTTPFFVTDTEETSFGQEVSAAWFK